MPAADANANATAARQLGRWLLISAGAVTLAWFALIAFWEDAPFTLTFDDAYYYFGIARNIAAGHGSTFDGINLTNGYHPLWMAICLVPFKLGLDDLAAARTLLLVQIVIGWGAGTAMVARIVSRAVDGWSGAGNPSAAARRAASVALTGVFVLVIVNPFIVKTFVNGLESGVVITVDAALLLLLARPNARLMTDTTDPWRVAVGVLLALAFLARTDAVFLLVPLALWTLAEAIVEIRAGRLGVGRAGLGLVELFAPVAVTAIAYLGVNQRTFGTAVQVSGLVKRAPLNITTVLTAVIVAAVAALIGWYTFRRAHGGAPLRPTGRPARFPLAGAFAVQTGWFASFAVLTLGYYNVLQTQQWLWYYAPPLLWLIVLFLLAVADVMGVALAMTAGERPVAPARALGSVVAVFAIPLVAALAFQTVAFADPSLRSIQQANRRAGEWIRADLPADAVLASWDAGVVGYFSHAHVVNIDGVVNSLTYEQAMRDGTVPRFLRCEHVAFVTNHGQAVNGHDPDIVKLITDVYGPAASAGAAPIYAEPFRYSGSTNTGGFELSGERELTMWVYRIPPLAVGPRPDDQCPSR